MALRLAPPALALLACLALSSGAAASTAGFTASAVTGTGTFSLRLEEATWAAVPPSSPGWHLDAASVHVKLQDDQRHDRIPDPRDPTLSEDLSSRSEHPSEAFDFAGAGLDIVGTHPDALVLGLGALRMPVPLRAYGPLSITPAEEGVLERSHFYASDAAPDAWNYAYTHGPGPAVALGVADLPAGNGTRLYVWGADLTVRDASGATQVIRTGTWEDPPPSRVKHHAYALIDLQGVQAPLRVQQATAYATALTVEGAGDLVFHAARGALSDRSGTLRLDGDARVAGGTFRLALDAPGITSLRASADAVPDSYSGAVVWQPRPFPWLATSLAAAATLAALYALPAARGLILVRRTALSRAPRHLRSEAYAHWASRAQMHDWLRLAIWLEGRAVHNAPAVGEFRTEHAILLRQAGRLAAALEEHRRAHELLASGPDGGYLALNAFQAALAGAEAGEDAEALRWLQAAIESDRGLVAEAQAHPTLRRLRSHPDYGAVTA